MPFLSAQNPARNDEWAIIDDRQKVEETSVKYDR